MGNYINPHQMLHRGYMYSNKQQSHLKLLFSLINNQHKQLCSLLF